MSDLQNIFSIFSFSFLPFDNVLRCTEVFNFDKVPFVFFFFSFLTHALASYLGTQCQIQGHGSPD